MNRQRLEQEFIDDAKKSGIGANPDRQGEDRNRGKAGVTTHHPERVPHVLPELIEPVRNPHGASIFTSQRHVPEFSERSEPRLFRRHPSLEVGLRLPLDVIANVRVEIVERMLRLHTGLSTRAIARANFSHLDVSSASCFFPFAVSR